MEKKLIIYGDNLKNKKKKWNVKGKSKDNIHIFIKTKLHLSSVI